MVLHSEKTGIMCGFMILLLFDSPGVQNITSQKEYIEGDQKAVANKVEQEKMCLFNQILTIDRRL